MARKRNDRKRKRAMKKARSEVTWDLWLGPFYGGENESKKERRANGAVDWPNPAWEAGLNLKIKTEKQTEVKKMEQISRNIGTGNSGQDTNRQNNKQNNKQKFQNPEQEKTGRNFGQDGTKQKMPRPEEERTTRNTDGNKQDPNRQEYKRPEEERSIGADDKPKHYQPEEDADLGKDKDEL